MTSVNVGGRCPTFAVVGSVAFPYVNAIKSRRVAV